MMTANSLLAAPAMPCEIGLLDAAVKHFRQVAESCNAQLRAVAAAERASRGLRPGSASVTDGHYVNGEAASGSAAGHVVRIAEQAFGVPGVPLRIPREGIPNLDPCDLWAWLFERFGDGQAIMLTYRPLARDFVSAIALRRDQELRIVQNRLSIRTHLWENDKGSAFAYGTADRLQRVLKGFLTIAHWAGFWGDSERAAVQTLLDGTRSYRTKPLQRIELGPDILIVPCLSSWEFRLSMPFAEKVQLFIAEFDGFGR